MASPRSAMTRSIVGNLTINPTARLSTRVAANLRWEAARYDLRQEDLAELLGCSRTAVSQRFNGKVAWTLDEIGLVADALGVKPGYFLEEPVEAAWRASGH